jgi:hypothetical protein
MLEKSTVLPEPGKPLSHKNERLDECQAWKVSDPRIQSQVPGVSDDEAAS